MKKSSVFPLFCLCLSGLVLSGETAVLPYPDTEADNLVDPAVEETARAVPPRILEASLEALKELRNGEPGQSSIEPGMSPVPDVRTDRTDPPRETLSDPVLQPSPPIEAISPNVTDPEVPSAARQPMESVSGKDPATGYLPSETAEAVFPAAFTAGGTGTDRAIGPSAEVETKAVPEPASAARTPQPARPGILNSKQDSVPGEMQEAKPSPQPQFTRPLPDPKAIPVRDGESIVSRNSIVSYYGHPNSKKMGILGEYPIEELVSHMKKIGAEYDYGNGEKGVVFAFHIIFGTVWKGGDIGYLNRQKLQAYIDYAEKSGMLVFLDHQLGKFGVRDSMKTMLPYLSYRSVHLAIDPEWHTPVPGEKLGSITAEELNDAQDSMSSWMKENRIPGRKMLMVHQFNYTMIQGRERVKADFPGIDLIHNADGFGNPGQKYGSYNYNKLADNIPLKGFKLFYPTALRDWGWDKPLLKPAEVLKLVPQPVLIMYQ